MVLTPMLNEFGKLIGDFTIAKAGDEKFMIWGSSAAQKYHMRWFEKHLPKDGSVTHPPFRPDAGRALDRRAEGAGAAAEAGRRGRLDEDFPLHGLPRDGGRRRALHGQPHHLHRRPRLRDLDGAGLSATGLRGDQGSWRGVRHRRFRHARAAVDAAGEELPDLVPRAATDLRVFEGSMDRFIKMEKNDFIGRDAAARELETGPKLRRVSFVVDAAGCRRDGRRADLGKGDGTDYGTVEKPHGYGAPRFDDSGKEVRGSTAANGGDPPAFAASSTATGASSAGSRRAAMRITSQKSMAQGYVPAALAEDESEACSRSKSSATAALPASMSPRLSIRPAKRCGGERDRGFPPSDANADLLTPNFGRQPQDRIAVRASECAPSLDRANSADKRARKGRLAQPACTRLRRAGRSRVGGRRHPCPGPAAMRKYRLERIRAELRRRDYAGALLYDPVNIRYATDSTNMQLWVAHNPTPPLLRRHRRPGRAVRLFLLRAPVGPFRRRRRGAAGGLVDVSLWRRADGTARQALGGRHRRSRHAAWRRQSPHRRRPSRPGRRRRTRPGSASPSATARR